MDIAFVVDPLPSLKAYKDSSVAMMRALAKRGHRIHAVLQPDLSWDRGRTFATGREILSAPALHNGVIYFGSMDGFLYAIH